jgi:hypothetical protein
MKFRLVFVLSYRFYILSEELITCLKTLPQGGNNNSVKLVQLQKFLSQLRYNFKLTSHYTTINKFLVSQKFSELLAVSLADVGLEAA